MRTAIEVILFWIAIGVSLKFIWGKIRKYDDRRFAEEFEEFPRHVR